MEDFDGTSIDEGIPESAKDIVVYAMVAKLCSVGTFLEGMPSSKLTSNMIQEALQKNPDGSKSCVFY